jgi:signal transduction histidine kinase
LTASALLLAASLVSQSRTRTTLADLVVELGPARISHGARVALARALGDASLQVGYWMADAERYVDADGRSVSLPSDQGGRAATVVERDGVALAILVHDRALLDDSLLAETMHDATALLLANVRLEAEVATALGELRASSRRILQARDDQRRRLARRLHDGAERRLGEVAGAVGRARTQAPPEVRDLELLDVLERELKQAREEVAALAQGIHPRTLIDGGLAAALSALVERAPVSIELITPAARLPAPIEVAAYFVCSEAVTNVTKYSRASHARCEVSRTDGHVRVSVVDDGIGGADPRHGSGLRGLADRIDALGGTFNVTSPPGKGTTVHAELPLDGSWLTSVVER